MTQPINLRQARKQRDRDERRSGADASAAKHGRSKAERILEATRHEKARAKLDQHYIEDE
jgi:hypothetical protein